MSDSTATTPVNRLAPIAENDSPAEPAVTLGPEATENSSPFVGQWQTLISTTNWEKGRIICEWRAKLEDSGAAASEYSDEAWAGLVGNVTGQHVGRLRRVHQRFGDTHADYAGLYWSHFQAAAEWQDAEMWLEGAIQNQWSVSQMRGKRWETIGDTPEASEARAAEDEALSATDDDGEYGHDLSVTDASVAAVGDEEATAAARETAADSPSEASSETDEVGTDDEESNDANRDEPNAAPIRPFENLAELPEDLAEAFEQMKLAILTHKLAGWEEVSRDDVLGALESLKILANAPADD